MHTIGKLSRQNILSCIICRFHAKAEWSSESVGGPEAIPGQASRASMDAHCSPENIWSRLLNIHSKGLMLIGVIFISFWAYKKKICTLTTPVSQLLEPINKNLHLPTSLTRRTQSHKDFIAQKYENLKWRNPDMFSLILFKKKTTSLTCVYMYTYIIYIIYVYT